MASPTIGRRAADRLSEVVAASLDALDQVDQTLVHSDAGLGNAVWDGRAAVPVDFEFACVGPVDLDLERLARETAESWRPARSLVAAAEGKSWADRAINELPA